MTKEGKLALVIGVLSLAGAVLSLVSLFHHTTLVNGLSQGPSFCNISAAFNCDAVNQSSWSKFLGLPLAGYGLAFYLCLFLGSLILPIKGVGNSDRIKEVFFVLTLVASLASIFLFIISEIEIGTLCLLCIGMYLVNFALLATAIFIARPSSIVVSCARGFKSLLQAPVLAFTSSAGLESGHRVLLRFFLIVAILMSGFSLTLDSTIIGFLTGDSLKSERVAQQLDKMVADWRTAEPMKLKLNFEGAAADYFKGPDEAPIVVVEFSDFECPACKHFYQILEELSAAYPEKIKLVLKNYPLDSACNLAIPRGGHQNACLAAYVARCAGEQGRFWQAADYLFRMRSSPGDPTEAVAKEMKSISEIMNLDDQAFNECLSAERTKGKIASDIAEGRSINLAGTPTVMINGRQTPSLSPIVIKAIFDEILRAR